ncbi:alpha-amylase [Neorhodopirellula pilleata]|uniref:Alpha-amylase n=1 Tax=Neorhodopirellula pilleata TaxID=2714738 RepID=A0A5C6APU3_9BACT|nr:alpha-amylase [Neorhodopirellula pilleata]TWU01730.1 Alpha-amylase precursor [Neorhodopirellula pilleata]
MGNVNGVLMQFFHWYSPDDGSLWRELGERSEELAGKGITALWLPPTYKGNGGVKDVGYAVYDMYDLGEFDQKGSVRTKYGTREELIEATQKARSAGIQIYTDVVLNHRIGGDHEEEILATPYHDDNRNERAGEPRVIKSHTHFSFPGRAGTYSDFQWRWQHFTAVDFDGHESAEGVVFLFDGKEFDQEVDMEKGSFDYLMGCDVDVKHPEVQAEIKRWGEWYHDTVGLDGVRFDAVKHVEAGFFPQWLHHVREYSQSPVFAVGEYWSYDVEALHHFIGATGGNVALFDAPLHRNFSDASKSGSDYDLTQIFDGTLVKNEPALAVTLVANHDTQPLQALESVVEAWFKPIAYSLILLRRDGYPCIFYPDYYGASYKDVGRDGNEYEIEMASHQFLIDVFLSVRKERGFGEQFDYFDHPNTVGWTRTGDEEHPGGLAVLITNGEAGTKRMKVGLQNQSYVDATGHVADAIVTDENGEAEFRCQARSVSVWVPA